MLRGDGRASGGIMVVGWTSDVQRARGDLEGGGGHVGGVPGFGGERAREAEAHLGVLDLVHLCVCVCGCSAS